MGQNACDDGNTRNGDGCSSTCQVEANYECFGGNETTADTCVNRKQPEFAGLKYYGNRTGVVTFTSAVRFLGNFEVGNVMIVGLESLLAVSLEGGDYSYVEWSYAAIKKKYNKRITLYFAFNYSLTGAEVPFPL